MLEDEAKKILPPGTVIDYAGESRQLRKEGNTLVTTHGPLLRLDFSCAGRAI